MAFPGCMHCLWHDGDLRTLRTVPFSEQSGAQSAAREYYYPEMGRARRLFPKILPDFAGIDDYETEDGYCVHGFGNAACPLDISASSYGSRVNVLVIMCMSVVAVLFQSL